jgi:hypothetical protein
MARSAVMTQQAADSCELCGARLEGGPRKQLAHMRREHPAYARGVLSRLAAPLVFMLGLLVLGAFGAPQWTYLVPLASGFLLMFGGRQRSRAERAEAGAARSLSIGQMIKAGGWRIALVVASLVAIIYMSGRG